MRGTGLEPARRVDGTGNKAWERMARDRWTLDDFLLSRYFANLQSQFIYRFALEKFDFVGLTERLADSVSVLGQRYSLFRDLPVLQSNTMPQDHRPPANWIRPCCRVSVK